MKHLVMTFFVCLLVFAIVDDSSAQDFSQLLKAVDRVEKNLESMVNAEAEARKEAVNQLQAELANAKKSQGGVQSGEALSELKNDIDLLAARLLALEGSLQGPDNETKSTVNELLGEIAYLKTELENIKTESDRQSAMLASTEQMMPQESSDPPQDLSGEVSEWPNVEIAGFVDVLGSYNRSVEDKSDFNLGQAEIDLESDLSDRIGIALAVAYNSDDGVFELGAAEIGINLYESDEGFLNSVDITAGQFDVPFGIDYNYYPSIERKLISGPLVVDNTHAGWNDFGFKFGLESGYGNFVFYGVNGYESAYEVTDTSMALALGVSVGDEIETRPAYAFGTRLGVSPIPMFELGTSFAIGLNQSEKDEMLLWGGDIQFWLSDFYLKGEYITHSYNRSIEKSDDKGYYAQGLYDFGRFFVSGRYGSFKPDGEEWNGRFSIGGGYVLMDQVELRIESNFHDDSDENNTILQLVAGF